MSSPWLQQSATEEKPSPDEIEVVADASQQAVDPRQSQPGYMTIAIGHAWLAGYRPELYWSNTTKCFDRITNFTYILEPAL